MANDGVKLYDEREPGKYYLWDGDLPENTEGLGKCLASSNWSEAWDEG